MGKPIPHPVFQGAPLAATGFEVLTVGTVGTAFGSVPAGGTTDVVAFRVEAGDVRFRVDGGTPTATVGIQALTTDSLHWYERVGTIDQYRFIRSGTVNGTVTATYFQVR